jgi:hypothetical protein
LQYRFTTAAAANNEVAFARVKFGAYIVQHGNVAK